MCHLRLFYFCFLFVVAAVLANKDVYIIIQWHTATNYLKTALCTTLLRLFVFRFGLENGTVTARQMVSRCHRVCTPYNDHDFIDVDVRTFYRRRRN